MDRQSNDSNEHNLNAASFPEGAGQTPQQQTPPPSASGPGETSGEQPPVDYEAIARQREQEVQAERQRAQQLEHTLGQVQQWAQRTEQQQQAQQEREQFQQRKRDIISRANTMRVEDAERYISTELDNLYSEFDQKRQRMEQTLTQRQQQIVRQIATPLYIDDLVKKNGLPEAAKQELMSYGDPDIAARQVPHLKQRYEREKQLQQQLEQLSKQNKARNVQQSGVTNLGGYDAAQEMEIPDGLSADQKASYILYQLENAGQ